MISEASVDSALRHLRESAQDAAQARAEAIYLAEFIKTVRARVKVAQTGMSNAAAEDIALTSPEYLEALQGYRAAVEKDSFYRFKREAAGAIIESWRTEQANLRAEGKAYG